MKKSEFLSKILRDYDSGKIPPEVYDYLCVNVEDFCDEDDEDFRDERFPSWYTEIEYDDFDSEESINGARFDDMNFLRYFER